MTEIKVSASILSADMANLEKVAHDLKGAGADMLHFDVMDGHFVPNLTFGMPVLSALRRCTDLFLDVHLMIDAPETYAIQFVKAGADLVTFHLESQGNPQEILAQIHAEGAQAGIVLKPATPWEEAIPYLEDSDVILVMTVEPGFGGQAVLPDMMGKVHALRAYITEHHLNCRIEVDGGINDKTARVAVREGADLLVMGSYLFRQEDMRGTIEMIRANATIDAARLQP